MPKVKNQMSEEDRKNLELIYEDVRFNALITFTFTFTCFIMAAVIICQVPTIYGLLGAFFLMSVGIIEMRWYGRTVHWKRGIILKKLGVRKTAEKYGLVKRRKLRNE